ncbi:hypothetical protein K3H47_19055 [Aeromonas veronii]|uniref:hypothetical protein n=2 Tax=Aeromonas veronii TaxID=654 RepID=UPI001F1DDC75|nr:hypothetical protein [Aeromonas veronii]MCF5766030.1 hypothetical protein [Aeromonas veronii]
MGHSNGKIGQRESRHCPFLPVVCLPGWRCISSEELWKNEMAEVPGRDLLLFTRPLHVARNLARQEEGHRWKNEAAEAIAKDLLLFIQSFLGHNLAQ